MNRVVNEYLPGLWNALSGIAVVVISIFVDARYEAPIGVAKLVGLFLVVVGMGLAIWAAGHLKAAIVGEVSPKLSMLVKDGPYKAMRHPVYLGIILALLGTTVVVRSWPGIVILLLFFLPSIIYRAKAEERALAQRFGSEWETYVANTGFLLPRAS